MGATKQKVGLVLGLAAALTVAVGAFSLSAATPGADARVVLRNASGQPQGVVTFKQQSGFVVVTAGVKGLSPGPVALVSRPQRRYSTACQPQATFFSPSV